MFNVPIRQANRYQQYIKVAEYWEEMTTPSKQYNRIQYNMPSQEKNREGIWDLTQAYFGEETIN